MNYNCRIEENSIGLIKTNLESVLNYSSSIGGDKRTQLDTNLKKILNLIKSRVENEFTVWIYGSYTKPVSCPNDVDIIILLEEEDKNRLSSSLEKIYSRMDELGLDLNIKVKYDEDEEAQVLENSLKDLIIHDRDGNTSRCFEIKI